MGLRDSYTQEHFRRARLSRDKRFDGIFYVGVYSTGIYCRPICPAPSAKESNVGYFRSALAAANAGLRPCLRCRPDSAPQSNPWIGTQTSVNRALALINGGALSGPNALSIEALAEKLGITSRYLRDLFHQHIGASPKQYALYRQLMFAKQLLHQTKMPITDVAFAAGFNSVRRFNELFQQQLQMTPSSLRKSTLRNSAISKSTIRKSEVCQNATETHLGDDPASLNLILSYRPPFNWPHMREFYRLRQVEGMEWIGDDHYGRSFQWQGVTGYFLAYHLEDAASFRVKIVLSEPEELVHLSAIVANIRRVLDLDADLAEVEQRLSDTALNLPRINSGVRIPGIWSPFEAACRAVLGQQVSVTQAIKLLGQLVNAYGEQLNIEGKAVTLFPTPDAIAAARLDELKMPGIRKQALIALAELLVHKPEAQLEEWLEIKGIGPWTLDYVRLRGLSLPDVLLTGDLVVKNQILSHLPQSQQMQCCSEPKLNEKSLDEKSIKRLKQKAYMSYSTELAKQVSPWGSYLTFQLWSLQ
ncbi:helix-turn-helix domain-containing protein [Shewanella sp. AS1]|uniref:DNA-3-methyladenine glycosylase 2 family protein n=1 Tax=Shewanella sp. AS1 TaxID=2907626 RepID=UPI001F2C3751|nr:AlkA N-terminal domain-containing protein [Shewanella sp. AS1]MCE9679441.1 helix-turn-helix domain-containing protein [Shewanella sp. AS1]